MMHPDALGIRGLLVIQGITLMQQIVPVSPDAFLSGVAPDTDKNLFLTAGARWMGDVVFDGEL